MPTSSNLSSIIRFYADKKKSGFIDFREFCTYVKKYAEHHVEEQADLVKYLGDPSETLLAEIQGLTEKRLVTLLTNGNKRTIISISFYSVIYSKQYKDILSNDSTPFPLVSDLPKLFPVAILERKDSSSYIPSSINNHNSKSPLLYILEFSQNIPSLLLPACVPIPVLQEAAQIKIKKILKKDEFHDYFLKKLRGTNPAKEISIKNFFKHFVDENLKESTDLINSDDYYLWNQLCYFIRQDFEKIQDKTLEDINILQSVYICESYSTYLKDQMQTSQKKQDALKELELNLGKYPFFFSMNQILKFKNQNGKLLYGLYSEDDLKEFLQTHSTTQSKSELPKLLVFKVESGTRYFVYKNKIIQIVVKLCGEAHDTIQDILENKWFNALLNFEKLPEMTNSEQFERCLQKQVELQSPVLYSLLTANFMTLLSYEKEDDETLQAFQIFSEGKILPFSDLLMLKNSQILSSAKIRLPFVYSIPIISWIISLFSNKKKNTKKTDSEQKIETRKDENKPQKHVSKQEQLADQAITISKELIPEGSSLDRELNFSIKQWNKIISPEANQQLVEDVNSLIRDYTRRVVKTLSTTSFTKERVQNLAETLVKTPNMQKIKEEKNLTEYVTLYILKLVSNG